MKALLLLVVLIPPFVAVAVFAETPARSSKPSEPVKSLNIKTRVVKGKEKNVAEAFDGEIEGLLGRLAKEKDPRKRYADLAETSTKLAKLKNLGARPASEEKALEMGLVMETLEGLPAKKDFNPKDCPSYVEDAELRMGNRAGSDEEDPGVVKGLRIVKALCTP